MKTIFSMRGTRGFSMVELMVSIVIGLLALMFATRLVVGSETGKQASLGGSDAMQNGMLAMFSLQNDVAQAGFGLNDVILAGCNTVFSDLNKYALHQAPRGALMVAPLSAAIITSNGTAPDVISVYSGTSPTGTGTLRIMADYTVGNTITVDRVPYGFRTDDVIVAAPETAGGDCALAQISTDPSVQPAPPAPQTLVFAAAANRRFNSGNLGATYAAGKSRVFNLGPAASLSLHTWTVREGFLLLRATNLTGASENAQTVIDNVVSVKAQYGFDERVGAAFTPENGTQITRWSPTMVDADKDTVTGGAGDYQRIAALRIAVVARSRAPQKPNAAGECTATTDDPVVFATASPSNVAAVPMTLKVAVTNDTMDWKCYQYRNFEAIVPIRNSGWRPQ